jgi:hypothetical protein
MNKEIVIIIDGTKADVYREDSITLEFNSSILSDVSSIKCSGSKTIKLPKTATNDAIFDLPHMPSYESSKAHKVLPCSMYVDGLTIFEGGLCHLLSSDGDHYEVAMTFGIMHQGFEQWLKDKPKLRDLQDSDSDVVVWDGTAGVTTYAGGVSKIEKYDGIGQPSMLYIPYNVGLPLTNETRQNYNISPCVMLLEIMERIRRENALPFNIDNIETDMEMNTIVLTKNNNTSLQTITADAAIKQEIPPIQTPNNKRHIGMNINADFYNVSTFNFVYKGYGQMMVNLPRINLTMTPEMFDTTDLYFSQSAVDFFASTQNCRMVIEYSDGSTSFEIPPTKSGNTFYWKERTLTFDAPQGEDVEGKPLFKIYIRVNRWDSCPNDVWDYPNKGAGVTSWRYTMQKAFIIKPTKVTDKVTSFTVKYQNNSNDYPLQEFRLVPNLPDITQIDFINFLCKYYGMFPMQDGDSVAFVSFSRLFDNIDANSIYDWSEHLIESYPYYPNSVDLTLDGYAQRNVITYKEDKNDPVDVSASLVVEDESLEQEKKLIEFPFAASRGSLIPQYSLNNEGELQKNDVEYRIMRITYGENYENNVLKFTDDMKCQQILNRHYSELQDAIRKPMQIEEDVTLSLLDLQKIDYSKPVYLSKYGRYFAIISIQWTSDNLTSRVKLLRIK